MKKVGKKIKQLVIDCDKWLRGGDEGRLLNDNGHMCCLGFECKARGLKKDKLLEIGTPDQIEYKEPCAITGMTRLIKDTYEDDGIVAKNTDLVGEAISINDDTLISDKQRIEKLKKLFRRRKITLKFINIPEEEKEEANNV